ncbi:antitoxin [Pseudonocardiaceae bacterium YIM PH 21723]|nr:antitoxin [Pseudonocardiaceae bacterium YIM PH 21723]
MNFDELKHKASALLHEHGDKVEAGADQLGELAQQKFGHSEQIDRAVEQAKNFIPGGE